MWKRGERHRRAKRKDTPLPPLCLLSTDHAQHVLLCTPWLHVQSINISFTSFSLENSYDFVYLYQKTGGVTAQSPMGTYTGALSPFNVSVPCQCGWLPRLMPHVVLYGTLGLCHCMQGEQWVWRLVQFMTCVRPPLCTLRIHVQLLPRRFE